MTKPQPRTLILLILMVIVTLMVARQYLPMVQLPTASRIEAKMRELRSLQMDLQVAQKGCQDQGQFIEEMRQSVGPFWVVSSPTARLDQEINTEFSRIMRMAQLSGVAATQKVDMGREKPGSNLQEITLSADFKNITMREASLLFQQLRTHRNGAKFRWDYCKITPNNPRTPTGVNMSLRFKIYALSPEATALLENPAAITAAAPKANGNGNRATRGNNTGNGTKSRK